MGLVRRLWRELLGFGVVGAIGYVSDAIVFNLLYRHAPSLLASAAAVSVSTLVAYAGNRFWTFRKRERLQTRAEFGLFVLVSAGGFLITVSCVWFTKYVIGDDSRLAANLAQLGAGQVLGTLFRFWACHVYVFPESGQTAADGAASAGQAPTGSNAPIESVSGYQESDSLVQG
jgi:putative flippase GtrA